MKSYKKNNLENLDVIGRLRLVNPLPPWAIGFAIRRRAVENIRTKGFENSKRTLCSTPHGLSISERNHFSQMHWLRDIQLTTSTTLKKLEKLESFL